MIFFPNLPAGSGKLKEINKLHHFFTPSRTVIMSSTPFLEKSQTFQQLNLWLFRQDVPVELRTKIMDFGLFDRKYPLSQKDLDNFFGRTSPTPLPVSTFTYNNVWFRVVVGGGMNYHHLSMIQPG
jgi:hypothetical protein